MEPVLLHSNRMRINTMGQKELRTMIIVFVTLVWNIAGSLICVLPDLRKLYLKISMIYGNMIKYVFVNKWKHFTFLRTWILQNSEALGEHSFFQGNFDYLPKFNTSLFSLQQVTPGNFSYLLFYQGIEGSVLLESERHAYRPWYDQTSWRI